MKASSESGLWAQTISCTEVIVITVGTYHTIADRTGNPFDRFPARVNPKRRTNS
jgi:hypothetical protein